MRIVLDTASFVTAVRSSGGAAGEVLRMITERELTCLMDLKLSLEYMDVALRPEHVRASKLSHDDIRGLIHGIEQIAEPVKILVKRRPLSTDPDDDMILDVALNGRADAIVTTNTKHFAKIAATYKIDVFTPSELLQRLREEEKLES